MALQSQLRRKEQLSSLNRQGGLLSNALLCHQKAKRDTNILPTKQHQKTPRMLHKSYIFNQSATVRFTRRKEVQQTQLLMPNGSRLSPSLPITSAFYTLLKSNMQLGGRTLQGDRLFLFKQLACAINQNVLPALLVVKSGIYASN